MAMMRILNPHLLSPKSLSHQQLLTLPIQCLDFQPAIFKHIQVLVLVLPLKLALPLLLLQKQLHLSNIVLSCRLLLLVDHDTLPEGAVLLLKRVNQRVLILQLVQLLPLLRQLNHLHRNPLKLLLKFLTLLSLLLQQTHLCHLLLLTMALNRLPIHQLTAIS